MRELTTTETTSELNVFGLDGDTLGVDSGQVGVFEEGDEVGFGSFLESHDSGGLETKIRLEILFFVISSFGLF